MDPHTFAIQFNSNSYRRFDRSLYFLLAMNLLREPLECLYVIGLWMWLERGAFTNLIATLHSLPPFLIHELADEAVACLRGLNPDFPYSSHMFDIPMTCSLLDKDISLNFFHRNRSSAFNEIRDLVNEVCLPSVSDIMKTRSCGGGSASSDMYYDAGQSSSSASCLAKNLSNMRIGTDRSIALGKQPADKETPVIDRTLFVTFTKGYPVEEEEVLRFFRKTASDIDALSMHYVGPNEQHAFYARIIFTQGSAIPTLLNGCLRGRFIINGKPVWFRKFVQRDNTPTDCECPSADACVCDR